MADWSQLPAELLELISTRLPSEIDLLRFRSVCSTWRSSVPTLPSSPSRFPILPNDGISASFTATTWGFFLSKRTIYCVRPPHSDPNVNTNGWIIKLERDNSDRIHLLNPLTRSQLKPFPHNFPNELDFWNLQVRELCSEYTLQYVSYRPLATSIGDAGTLYMEKVAFFFDQKDGDFIVLTIHVSGKLVMYKSGDTKWTVINDLISPYDDVIFHQGSFFAVDNTGRTVVVNLDYGASSPNVSVAAGAVYGGDKKFLVESLGDLLLVDMYLSVGPEDDVENYESFEFFEEFDCFMTERTVKFKVFRLDRPGKSWVEVSTLGDRMLFLGDCCAFSASTSELPFGGRGNCIFFTDQFFHSRVDDGDWKSGVGVFDLGTGSIGHVSCYPDYAEFFWPPPAWIYPTTAVETRDELDGLHQLQL